MIPVWFRPWMAWAAAVAALALLLGLQSIRLADAERDVAAEKAAHAETRRLHAVALAKAISDARTTENQLRADLEAQQDAAAKEKEIAKSREDALVESVRAGNRRLSIAAVCPGSGGPGLRAPAAGGGGPGQARADIDPAAGIALIGIARDGDEAIRERNACVAAYEAVRQRLNAQSGEAAGASVPSGAR